MDDGLELITVSCSTHNETLLTGLWKLCSEQRGVDLHIRWEGQSIRAHWLIAELFLKTSSADGHHLSREINSTAVEQMDNDHLGNSALDSLLEFMYRGRATVRRSQLEQLLAVAREYEFEMLVNAIEAIKTENYGLDVIRPDRRPRKNVPITTPRDRLTQQMLAEESAIKKRARLVRAKKKKRKSAAAVAEEEDSEGDGGEGVGEDDHPVTDTTTVLRCPHCSYKTRRQHFFDVHQARHDPSIEVFSCATCHLRFLSRQALERHESMHSGAPCLYQCAHCPTKFRKKSAYDVHQAKHDPSIAVFRCDLCCQKFLSRPSLERHRQRHKGYKCPHCEFVAQKRWNYENHLFSVHEVNCSGKPLAKIKCSACDFSCVYEARLRYHVVAKHSGQKPFRCQYDSCDFASGTKSDVNKHHKAVHLKIKPFLCDVCAFCTVSQSQLDKHKRSHLGLKPHSCDICNKSYASIYTLKEHVRLHTSHDKPHVCHVCGRSYNRREHLNRHLKSVHKPSSQTAAPTTTVSPPNAAASVGDLNTQFLTWPSSAASLKPLDTGSGAPNLHCSYPNVSLHRAYL